MSVSAGVILDGVLLIKNVSEAIVAIQEAHAKSVDGVVPKEIVDKQKYLKVLAKAERDAAFDAMPDV